MGDTITKRHDAVRNAIARAGQAVLMVQAYVEQKVKTVSKGETTIKAADVVFHGSNPAVVEVKTYTSTRLPSAGKLAGKFTGVQNATSSVFVPTATGDKITQEIPFVITPLGKVYEETKKEMDRAFGSEAGKLMVRAGAVASMRATAEFAVAGRGPAVPPIPKPTLAYECASPIRKTILCGALTTRGYSFDAAAFDRYEDGDDL